MSLKKILTYSILTLTAVGGFFGHIDANINPTELANISIGIDSTYAATGDTTQQTVEMYNKAIKSINVVLAVLSALITPVILFVGWLMSPDWTSGDLFNMRGSMYQLWITVSNIVYFIYAVLLIMIALGTMFGDDKFSYKVMLPKLALGILMVPFTWWFVQWTVSIANVVTASVLTIPHDTISAGNSAWFKNPTIPNKITVDNTGTGMLQSEKIKCPEDGESKCISPETFLGKAGGMYGPLVVYGYSIFKFQEISELKNVVDVASAAVQIVHQSILSAIMFAVFGILILALAVMLLVRAIKLWMYAIFAPLFTFRFVAGSNMLGGDDDSFSIKEFIGLAFVPAIVGLTLSFGLIMINAVAGTHKENQGPKTSTPCKLEVGGNPCTIGTVFGSTDNKITRELIKDGGDPAKQVTVTKFGYGGVDFVFKGKAVNQSNQSTDASGVLDAVGGMFGTIIIDVIALVFIWMAFMAAKNVSKAVKAAVQPFEDIGNKVGAMAKKIPSYVPLPIPGGSIKGIGKVADGIGSIAEYKSNKKFDESGVGKWIRENSGGSSAEEIQSVKNAINKNGKTAVDELQNVANTMRATGKGSELYSASQRDNLDLLAAKVKSGDINIEHLKASYGDKIGSALYEKLKTGKIESSDDAKIIAAMLASRQGDTIIKTAAEAESRLKDTKSMGSASENKPTTLNLTINKDGTAEQIATAIKGSYAKDAITRTDLELALKEKFKGTEGKINPDDSTKITAILEALNDHLKNK